MPLETRATIGTTMLARRWSPPFGVILGRSAIAADGVSARTVASALPSSLSAGALLAGSARKQKADGVDHARNERLQRSESWCPMAAIAGTAWIVATPCRDERDGSTSYDSDAWGTMVGESHNESRRRMWHRALGLTRAMVWALRVGSVRRSKSTKVETRSVSRRPPSIG